MAGEVVRPGSPGNDHLRGRHELIGTTLAIVDPAGASGCSLHGPCVGALDNLPAPALDCRSQRTHKPPWVDLPITGIPEAAGDARAERRLALQYIVCIQPA